jgi:hypothetical protein
MKFNFQKLAIGLSAMLLFASTFESCAFALLGPVQPWMQATNGVILSGDIGGPMNVSNGYHWNVPVVTYGFDQSFLNFFGSNGVAAVQSAIQILNDLPPASKVVLTNYPLYTQAQNYDAASLSLYDLKSQTLSLLLEHLGLAQPTRNVYVLKQWTPAFIGQSDQIDWAGWAIPDYIVQRNFDPQTLSPTPYVNQSLYTAEVISGPPQNFMNIFDADPFQTAYNAVADGLLNPGVFYTGLTYDDVGGLAYLLSTNNINYETLLSGVVGVGTDANSYVNGAWRPGVDKITFIPQPVDPQSGAFLPTTNYFTDNYLTNDVLMQQQMARIISQPDFLFSAGNDSFRTGTTNWINNAAMNINTDGSGPGIIPPPVTITFQKTGDYFYSADNGWSEDSVQNISMFSGTFDGSTNVPIVYPVTQTGNTAMVVRVLLSHSNYPPNNFQSFEWSPVSLAGTVYALQTSTNLTTWNTLFVVTNNGSVCTYRNVNANSSSRFYRLISQ